MATRRIQDLENVEEVLADSIIPVGEATKTKSMLISQLKNWLSSFFVGKTGSETISGEKTFTSPLLRGSGFGTSGPTLIRATDANGKGISAIIAYLAGSGIYSRLISTNNTAQGKTAYIDVVAKDDGQGIFQTGGSSNMIVDFRTAKEIRGITPDLGVYDYHLASTSWVKNSGAVVTEKSLAQNGYVKFSSGLIMQWGRVEIGNKTITFPTAFSNNNIVVCPSAFYNSSSQVAFYDLTTTGCQIYPNRNDYVVKWFAIGY